MACDLEHGQFIIGRREREQSAIPQWGERTHLILCQGEDIYDSVIRGTKGRKVKKTRQKQSRPYGNGPVNTSFIIWNILSWRNLNKQLGRSCPSIM